MNKNTLILRRYQQSDLSSVLKLHKLALGDADIGDGPWDDDLLNVPETYINNRGDFLVGFCDRNLVAMGALRKINNADAEIKRIRVHPDYQRRGFGGSLLTNLESKAKSYGYAHLTLDTTIHQTTAIRFFQKMGYTQNEAMKSKLPNQIFFEKSI